MQNGGAYAWGNNYYGQLGNGSTNNSNTALQVSGLSSGVTAVAAGEDHSLALQNGGVYAWGWNYIGQLGNGTNTNSSKPVAVTGLSSGVTAIAAGWQHSLAVQNGNVFDWGNNSRGQLGNGTDINSNTPVEAIGITGTIVSVTASQFGSYALAADGSIWDWGENSSYDTETPQHLLPPTGYIFTGISANFAVDGAIAILAPVNTVAANLMVTPSMSLQLTGAGQSLNVANTLNLAGGSIIAPVMTVQSGGVFNASAGAMTIGGALTVNSGGSYNQTGGTVTAGSINATSASAFSFTGGTISMNSGVFTTPGAGLTIAGSGLPVLNLTAGAVLSAPTGSINVGAGGSLDVATGASVNAMTLNANGGFTTIAGGGSIFTATDVYVAYATSANVTVTGTNSKLSSSGENILIGSGPSTVATVNVTNGGQITGFGSAYLGTSSATVNLNIGLPNGNDTGGSLVSFSGNLDVPNNIAQAMVNVYSGGTLQIGAALNGNSGGQVNLMGGTISAGSLSLASSQEFNWTSGTLNITGVGASSIGSLTIPAGGILNLYANVGSGILVRNLGAITLSAGSAKMNVFGTSNSNNRQLIVMSGLTFAGSAGAWQGMLDLIDNDMDVQGGQGGSLSDITSQVKEAYNGGNWSGAAGIVSSYAAANTTHLTALGVIQNNQSGAALFTSSKPFDTFTPNATDILVKYTYYGDANLDGKVDGSDYTRIDNGYLNQLTGWFNGDFNYDGVVDGSDYTLIDNAFNSQGVNLTSEMAAATSRRAGGGSSVPEPCGVILLLSAAIGLTGRRVNKGSRGVRGPT